MPEIEAVIEDAKAETAFPNVALMLKCAREQKCTNADEYKALCGFIDILRAYHKEQSEVVKSIVEAAKLLNEKKKQYETNHNSLDDL